MRGGKKMAGMVISVNEIFAASLWFLSLVKVAKEGYFNKIEHSGSLKLSCRRKNPRSKKKKSNWTRTYISRSVWYYLISSPAATSFHLTLTQSWPYGSPFWVLCGPAMTKSNYSNHMLLKGRNKENKPRSTIKWKWCGLQDKAHFRLLSLPQRVRQWHSG